MKHIKKYNTLQDLSEYLQEFFDKNSIKYKRYNDISYQANLNIDDYEGVYYWDILSDSILIYSFNPSGEEEMKIMNKLRSIKTNLESRLKQGIEFYFSIKGIRIFTGFPLKP